MTLGILARPKVKEEVPVETLVRPPSDLVQDGAVGHYRKGRKQYLYINKKHRSTWRRDALAWLRDHVNSGIPRAYYNFVLGHDLHVSTWAELYVRHFHYGQPDPFTGQIELHWINGRGLIPGWWENVGLVSHRRVTDAFVEFEVDQLQTEDSEYGDFKFHRPGTDGTAESETHTALIADAGLESTGTQIEGATADIYKSVATVTADTTETWQEHSIRSQTGASGGTMMDRSLISPTVSVVLNDTVEFTYELTKNAETS